MPSSFKVGKPGPGVTSWLLIAAPVTTLNEARARMRGEMYVAAIILTVVFGWTENCWAVYCRMNLIERMLEFDF